MTARLQNLLPYSSGKSIRLSEELFAIAQEYAKLDQSSVENTWNFSQRLQQNTNFNNDLNPANQKLIDFLDEIQKLAKDTFGIAAQAIIEQLI